MRLLRGIAVISVSLAYLALVPDVIQAQKNVITTIAGGGPNNVPALSSSVFNPYQVVADGSSNLFISASLANRVYKVDSSGKLTVYAGTGANGYSGDGGAATAAMLNRPFGLALDSHGNLYIADSSNCVIREIIASTGIIQTVAGNFAAGCGYSGDSHAATAAQLNNPHGVSVDQSGNIFIADTFNNAIREVLGGNIITVVGINISLPLNFPAGVFVDPFNNIFIADSGNNMIRELVAQTGKIQTVTGNGVANYTGDGGPAISATLSDPLGVFVDASGNIFIADYSNSVVREIPATTITTNGITMKAGNIYTVAGNGKNGYTGDGGPATSATFEDVGGVSVDAFGNILIADVFNNVIREVEAATGNIKTVAGNGQAAYSGDGFPATDASLAGPMGAFTDGHGNIYIADSFNSVVREIVAQTGKIQTVAGNGTAKYSGDKGPATSATLNSPGGVYVDASGNLFIADTANSVIREVPATTITVNGITMTAGNIYTIAGNGTANYSGDNGPATSATLNSPGGIYVDASGNLFIADTANHVIREVPAATITKNGITTIAGDIYTVAGNGTANYSGDKGPATSATLNSPPGVFVDNSGNIFIPDWDNNVVREVPAATSGTMTAGNIYTVAGNGTRGYSGDGGPAASAQLFRVSGVLVDLSGNIFIADLVNNVIREVEASTGNIKTVAGNHTRGYSGDGGPALNAEIIPRSIAQGPSGNLLIATADFPSIVRSVAGLLSAPGVSFSATSVTFVNQTVGIPSTAQTITLTNSGTLGLTITDIVIGGANGGDFAQTNTCGSSVAVGANCSISVTFTPGAAGARSASLTVTDTASGSPQTVSLSGTGVAAAPTASLSGTSLSFSTTYVGVAATAQTITLTNSGTAALNVTSIAVSGTNSSDFAQTNTCGTSVAISAKCTISVTFTPGGTGARSASVVITDNASGSPQSISLSGAGIAASLAMASGSSASQTVKAGQTAAYNLQLTATGGAASTDQISATITCTGAPAQTTCTAPAAAVVATPATSGTFQVTVKTTGGATAQVPGVPFGPRMWPLANLLSWLVAILTLLVCLPKALAWSKVPSVRLRLVRVAVTACLVMLPVLAMMFAGCGGGSSSSTTPTQPGTYTLTVTATIGSQTKTTQLTLIVQ